MDIYEKLQNTMYCTAPPQPNCPHAILLVFSYYSLYPKEYEPLISTQAHIND